MYTEFVAHVWNALETLPEEYEPEITGMCWMQGESDALNRSFADAYEVNLTNFINDVRAEFDYPGMLFVIAMIDDSSRWTYRVAVRQAELNVADSMSNIGIFDTKGYPTDGMHYLSAGHLQLGVDFAACMLELITGTAPQ